TVFDRVVASSPSSGAEEYDRQGSHFIAGYVRPGLNLVVISKADWKKAIQATYDLIIKFALLGLMALGVALVFSIIFSRTLTRPINRLYQATKEMAQGNFD